MTRPSASVGTQPNARGSPTRTRCRVTSASRFAVGVEHRAQVGAAEHVAVEDHDVVAAQLRQNVADAATGAEWFGLGDVVDLETQLGTVAEVVLEDLRLERRAEHHVRDPGRPDPREQMLEERQTRRRQHGLGRRQRQRAKPRSLDRRPAPLRRSSSQLP